MEHHSLLPLGKAITMFLEKERSQDYYQMTFPLIVNSLQHWIQQHPDSSTRSIVKSVAFTRVSIEEGNDNFDAKKCVELYELVFNFSPILVINFFKKVFSPLFPYKFAYV